MTSPILQLLALSGAFWTALLLYRGEAPRRFVAALALAAVFAHLGWALLHSGPVLAHPWALLDPAGFSVLFAPLGLLALERSAAAFATLPLAIAVARLGGLAAGCCHGARGEPTPLVEIAALLALHLGLRRLRVDWTAPAVLAGLGLIRLLTEPWRATPPLGPPAVSAAVLAAAWIGAGVLLFACGSSGIWRRATASPTSPVQRS